jgi:hypothetical protein
VNPSLARYATSTKHITGCALAIVGPALALAGVLAPPVGLALTVPLYAVGARAAPASRHVTVAAGVYSREVQRSIRDVQRRARPPVATSIRLKITRITTTITELLPRADALEAGSPDQYVLVQCATDYLPTALQAYLDLPRSYADHHVVADGKTPLALLSEQLDVLAKQIDEIAERLNGAHSDKLIANGRFLAQKFGRGPLDLEAGGAAK